MGTGVTLVFLLAVMSFGVWRRSVLGGELDKLLSRQQRTASKNGDNRNLINQLTAEVKKLENEVARLQTRSVGNTHNMQECFQRLMKAGEAAANGGDYPLYSALMGAKEPEAKQKLSDVLEALCVEPVKKPKSVVSHPNGEGKGRLLINDRHPIEEILDANPRPVEVVESSCTDIVPWEDRDRAERKVY